MIRVLFVCLGNICRSPMAEAIFRRDVKEAGYADRIIVDSAGTGDWHIGKPPHHGTQDILTTNQISFEGMYARQVNRTDFSEFDYIIAMDTQNKRDLEQLRQQTGSEEPTIKLMLDFVSNTTLRDVPDPYYTGNFEEVYEMITEGSRNLLAHIIEKEGL